jgi:deoxyribodipyrimidine photolyase-related protein
MKTLRLIFGDQLNSSHSWFRKDDSNITYVMMELRSETDYAVHHIQKVAGFFKAMRCFAEELKQQGHQVLYLKIHEPHNKQSFSENIKQLIQKHQFKKWETATRRIPT